MMFPFRWIPAALAGAVLITACADAPTASRSIDRPTASPTASSSPEHSVEEALYDMDGSSYRFACTADGEPAEEDEGELVRMHGQIYEKYATRHDANGGVHLTIQTMPVGLGGIGEESGEAFRVKEQQHAAYSARLSGLTGAWRSELKLTGLETGRTFFMVVRGNYRVSMEGTVVVERVSTSISCKVGRG